MKKEKTVKTHTRKTKSGKTVTVKQHTAKYDAAEQAKEIVKKAGAGAELEKVKKAKMQEDPYKDFDFTAEEFAEWYEGTGSKADKKVEKALRKALGRKAYDELNDAAAESYKKGGADRFFSKEVGTAKDSAPKETPTPKEPKAKRVKEETPAVKEKTSKGKRTIDRTLAHYYARQEDIPISSAYSELREMDDKEYNGWVSDYTKSKEKSSSRMDAARKDSKSINAAMESPFKGQLKRFSGKTAVEAKKTLVNEGYEVVKDGGYTYLRKGKDMYEYIPSGIVMGGAQLVKLNRARTNEVLGKIGDKFKGSKSSKEPKGKEPKETSKESSVYRVSPEEFKKMSSKQQMRYFQKTLEERTPAGLGPLAVGKWRNKEAAKFRKYYGIDKEGNPVESKGKTPREKSKKESPTPKSDSVEVKFKAGKKLSDKDLISWAMENNYTGSSSFSKKGTLTATDRREISRYIEGSVTGREYYGKGKWEEPAGNPKPTKPRKKKKNTPEQDAALDATLNEIKERNKQPYQFSRR